MPISWTLLKELLYISSCSCFMANDQLEHISFALLNVRSLANKPFIINDIVNSCSIDIFFQQDILIFFFKCCLFVLKWSKKVMLCEIFHSACPSVRAISSLSPSSSQFKAQKAIHFTKHPFFIKTSLPGNGPGKI